MKQRVAHTRDTERAPETLEEAPKRYCNVDKLYHSSNCCVDNEEKSGKPWEGGTEIIYARTIFFLASLSLCFQFLDVGKRA